MVEFNIDYGRVSELSKKIQNALDLLKPFKNKVELDKLIEIKKNLEDNVKGFEDNDRKLKIGIIGQVKAGKSSFINSLLFQGKDILPKAATPKTSNLTIIKYGKQNSIEIEFIPKKEFEILIKNIEVGSGYNGFPAENETKKLYDNSGISIDDYQDTIIKEFNSYSEFEGMLEQYAGDKGKFTAIVKHVILNINDERLKDIEIIDTPGMNDPVISRTAKTREFLKKADVIFFLSKSFQFLDSKDMELLMTQLPQKGVQSLVALGTKFDSTLIDEGWNFNSYNETLDSVKKNLKKHSLKSAKSIEKKNYPEHINTVLKSAFPPVFISSILNNIIIKKESEYSYEEKDILEQLNEIAKDCWNDFKFTKPILKELANFEVIHDKFHGIIKSKTETLQNKLENMIPNISFYFKDTLKKYLSGLELHIERLEKGDIKQLENQKFFIEAQKNQIRECLASIINKIKDELDKAKFEMIQSFRNEKSNMDITERTGTETHTKSYYVSTSELLKPWTWFTGYTATRTYTTSYKYCMVSDAVEHLVLYADECSNRTEYNFNKILNKKEIKFELKKALIHVLNTDSEEFSPEYFKSLIEETINFIEIPVMKTDISSVRNNIIAKFSGEVRGASQISDFKLAFVESMDIVFEKLAKSVEDEIQRIVNSLDKIKSDLFEGLTIRINREIEKLESEFKNQENEIAEYEKLIKIINRILSFL